MNFIETYYRGALTALRFVDPGRFGSEADAAWFAFAGDPAPTNTSTPFAILASIDRAMLMLTDADRKWPGAFGARTVFGLRGVAMDEAFGSDWPPLRPRNTIWEEVAAGPVLTSLTDLALQLADIWGSQVDAVEVLPDGERWALRSAGAIVAFVGSRGAEMWASASVVVPAPNAWSCNIGWRHALLLRQLAGAVGALAGRPTNFAMAPAEGSIVVGPELVVVDEAELVKPRPAKVAIDHGSSRCAEGDFEFVWNDRSVIGMERKAGTDILHHPLCPAWIQIEELRPVLGGKGPQAGHDGWYVNLLLGRAAVNERLFFRRGCDKAEIKRAAELALRLAIDARPNQFIDRRDGGLTFEQRDEGAFGPGPRLCLPNGCHGESVWDPKATSGPWIEFGEVGGYWGLPLYEEKFVRGCRIQWNDFDAMRGTCRGNDLPPALPPGERQMRLFEL